MTEELKRRRQMHVVVESEFVPVDKAGLRSRYGSVLSLRIP